MKKTISAILSAVLLLSSITACGNSQNNKEETQNENPSAELAVETENTEELSDYELRQQIPDNLPDVKFDGRDFRISTSSSTECDYYAELFSDELNGDACNDAIFNRNV